ncbi:MAG: DUF302 domain-containing protein [Streptosporangiaceae bacterium]
MADGLITLESAYTAAETINRLAGSVTQAGLHIFARVDHAAGAGEVGMPLRPTLLLIFGQARGGTPLMQENQTAGIDLPLKALAWTDADGRTWLSYDDPEWIARRHGLGAPSARAVQAMRGALAKQAGAAAGTAGPVAGPAPVAS